MVFLNRQGLVSLCAAEQSQLEYRGLAARLKPWSIKLFYYESIKDYAVWWVTGVFREFIGAKWGGVGLIHCVPHPSICGGAPS